MPNVYYQRVKHPARCACGSGLPTASIGYYVHGRYHRYSHGCPVCIHKRSGDRSIRNRAGCAVWPELEAAFNADPADRAMARL